MATNPLRDAIAAKYGGNTTGFKSTANQDSAPEITPVRAAVVKKYSAPEPVPSNIVQGPGGPALQPGPVETPAAPASKTLREQLMEKYAAPTPDSPAGKEFTKEHGSVASPEFFATSVSVRDPRGNFVKDFTGKENGEAEAAAKQYADTIGGTIAVTPPAGFLGKMFTRAQDVFKSALDNFAASGEKALQTIGNVRPAAPEDNRAPGSLVGEPSTPVAKTATGVDFGVAGIGVLLAPLAAAFSAGEEIPGAGAGFKGLNFIFDKVGEAGGWAADKVVDNIPISEEAKSEIRPAAEHLSSLLAQIAAGKASGAAYERTATLRENIKTAVTKDIIHSNQLPRTVYVAPEAVRSIFSTGKEISPEELELIKGLGLSSTEYKSAIKNGVTLAVPSERITTIADKPWFARVKNAIGIKPFSETVVDTAGKPVKVPNAANESLLSLPEGEAASESIQPVKTAVEGALTAPITPKLLDRIAAFTPIESSAFGKKIVASINEAIGTKISESAAKVPENIDVIETRSGDGRPAQFRNGRIELFLPNLLEDLRDLAAGKEILAHEGEFSTVYKKVDGESMEELASRYVRDIILHEASHQKTLTLEDMERIRTLQRDINQAKLSKNDTAVVEARQQLSAFMRTLEDKANAYMRDNRASLEKEFLNGPKRETQTEIQRRIAKTTHVGIPQRTQARLTEKQSLIQRLKARSQGAKEGFQAGFKEGEFVGKQVASQYERTIAKIRDRQASIEQKRKDLIDYAQLLPFRERGKFLKAINNTKSDREFLDVLARMQKASKMAERRVLISKITSELKGAVVSKKGGTPNVKFALEAQRTLNDMIRFQKSLTYSEAQVQIAAKISTWQTQHPDAAIPVELLREIDVLKTVGIKEQTLDELSYTLSAIQSLKETGRTKREIEIFNRETEIQQKRDKILNVITGGRPLPSDKLSIKTRETRPGALESAKDFLTKRSYGFEEVLDVLSLRDLSSRPYESFLSTYAGDRVNEAFNAQNKNEFREIDGISKQMQEIYGLEKNTEIILMLHAIREVNSYGEFRHTDGKFREINLSRGEAMQYYMWLQDETLLETFTETLQWTPEIMDVVKNILSDADKKMADWLIGEFYPKYYEGINRVYNKDYGVDLPYNPNYSPVHRAIDASIPENVLLAQESAKYATARNGSLKERQNSHMDLKATDAFENVMRHIAKMEHYKAWSESMFEFRRIFGNKEVRQAIVDIHGQGYMNVLDNFLNDFARDGVAREKIVKAVDALRSNSTKALLGANLKVGAKQLIGVLNYGIELPTKDFFAGLADFWTDPLGHAKFLYDNSLGLQERFGEGYERDIKFAIQKGYDKRLAGATNWSEKLFIPIRNADRFTVYQGSWAAYRYAYNAAKTAGKSDAEAQRLGIREAENITNRVQESSRLDTLSELQRGGSIAKLFTMFQSQPSKYIRIMMNAGRNYKAGRLSGTVAARRIFWAWIVVPFFYNLWADQFIDKKYRESSGGLVVRTLLGPITYPLIIGQMFQQLYGWTAGERFTYQASPVESFMNDLQSAVSQFKTGDAVDGTTYMLDVAGKLSGVPTTVVTKPVRNARKDAKSSGGAPASF